MNEKELNKINRDLKSIGFELSHEDKEFNIYYKNNIRLAVDFEGGLN